MKHAITTVESIDVCNYLAIQLLESLGFFAPSEMDIERTANLLCPIIKALQHRNLQHKQESKQESKPRYKQHRKPGSKAGQHS